VIRGEEREVVIESVATEGKSIVRIDGLVVFVRGGVPGDRARIRITFLKKSFAEGEVVEVLEPSPSRVTPRCRHYGVCGGCTWQNTAYDAQCAFKRQHVVDALERIGGFTGVTVAPTLGSEDPFYYRNKMEFSFGDRWLTKEELTLRTETAALSGEAERFALGLHIPARWDKILDLQECWLQSPSSVAIVNFTRAFMLERKIPLYSTDTNTGYLRNLIVREGRGTGDRMVNLVTRDDNPEVMREYTTALLVAVPGITTVVNNITTKKSQVAFGERETVYHGLPFITERIGKRVYRISANSFFQTNTRQAERLYDTVLDMAEFRPDDVVFDLYSGTGTIALHVADHVRTVMGVESVAPAVDDARRNAEENGVTNCSFLLGDLKDTLIAARKDGGTLPSPDVIILDPPRAGMHEKAVRELLAMNARRIVYVSCNPATQARDLKLLCEGGRFRLEGVQPVDMFPHTNHIENVAALIRTAE
jgi:23S rRNA (uracil1939-C5)-methyltransferase